MASELEVIRGDLTGAIYASATRKRTRGTAVELAPAT